jgi:membrane associated rhomboid family serine protease
MTIQRGIGLTVLTTLGFGAGGAGLGAALGAAAPGYYRFAFYVWLDGEFIPVQVGIGLGATQGARAGLLVGVLLGWALVWREARRQEAGSQPPN